MSVHLESLRYVYNRHDAKPSQLQRDVSTMLAQMGWTHGFEHLTEEGLSVDIAQPEFKCAIEVDGPSHYHQDATSGEYFVNGATSFKARLLRSFGWNLARVPFYEWDGLSSEEERRHLLIEKLAGIGVHLAATATTSTFDT